MKEPHCPNGYKRCTKCGECKPETEEYFPLRPNKRWLQSWCCDCTQIYIQKWRTERLGRDPEYQKILNESARKSRLGSRYTEVTEATRKLRELRSQGLKICCKKDKCINPKGCILPATEEYFVKKKGGHLGLGSVCKVCFAARSREKYQASPDAHIKRTNEHARQLRLKKDPRVRVFDSLHNTKRKARKRALPDTLTKEQWLAALEWWGWTCAYCGSKPGLFDNMKLCADHYIPLTSPECPGTIAENMLPACKSCNSSKHTKVAGKWLSDKYGNRKAAKIVNRIQVYFRHIKGE